MKTLVVYYSRSGNTSKIAHEIADSLECDVEEIKDTKKRSGIIGWLKSANDARKQSLTTIEPIRFESSQYDLLIIGTPIWAGHVSTPVRTYIHQHQANFNNVAFFCTAGGDNVGGTFIDMTDLSGITPVATLGVKAKEIKKGTYKDKIKDFVKAVQM